MIKSKSTSQNQVSVTLKYHLLVTFWDDFLSSHIGKPYDMPREDLLADRTSFMSFDLRIRYTCTSCLLFIGQKPCCRLLRKSCPLGFSRVLFLFSVPDHCLFTYFQYNLFYLCVCVCVCVCACLSVLDVLQCIVILYYICRLSAYELTEVVLRIPMILSLLLCFKCMHELLNSLTVHF